MNSFLEGIAIISEKNQLNRHYFQENRRSLAAYQQILKQISHIYQAESRGSNDFVEGAKEK